LHLILILSVLAAVVVMLLGAVLILRDGQDVERQPEDSRLTQQPESALESGEAVTASPVKADRSRCPACAAPITAYDERCPSCEIAFVADGLPGWGPKAVGPADGIWSPPTEVSE
jgi:hypothetical protein